jgi:hypothetical protein
MIRVTADDVPRRTRHRVRIQKQRGAVKK